ncbi:ABC transporter permease subunit [Kineosporia sp. A_224]|uniref:ABC transporter permease subunit n=1 Tax=Kineosporia sp. A_224 TaxID=1962180 RepID=UPI000B4BAB8A|nr:ABC transporter permease subunit [Kineosporia sp. A_224]
MRTTTARGPHRTAGGRLRTAGLPGRGRPRPTRNLAGLPAFVWLAAFFVLPAGLVAVYSLGESSLFGSSPVDLSRPTTDRYQEAFSDTFRIVLANTLRLSVVGTTLCVLLALPVAYAIATRIHGRWRYLVVAAVVVPYWTPFLLRTYAWRILLDDRGPLTAVGVHDGFGLLDTRGGAQLGVVYNYLPLAILPIFVALDRLDPAVRRAGRDLGATPWRVFWQVTLPAVRPGLITAALLVFVPLMGDYVTPSVLGGVRATVVGNFVYDSFLAGQDWALGAAAAVILVGVVAALLALAWVLSALAIRVLRIVRPLDITARLRARTTTPERPIAGSGSERRERDLWGVALRGYTVLLVAFLWLPILTIVSSSFNTGNTLAVWTGFGTRWYTAVPHNDALLSSIAVSLRVAALSTVVAVLIGTLAGIALVRAGRATRTGLNGLLVLVFTTPEIVTAVGLLVLYVAAGTIASDGTARLVIAHSVISVTVVAFVVRARLAGLDPRLPDAAADLGAAPGAVLRKVLLPLTLPAVAAGAMLASTTSLDDVVTSSMLGNVGTTTLPVYIYSTLRTGLKGDAAAAGVLLTCLVALSTALVVALLGRRRQGAAAFRSLLGG